MDRYQRVEKPKAETPIDENEIRITSQGRMRSYITYAMTLLEKFVDSSKLKPHFLRHTGEKDFVCPHEGCGKAFSIDFNLRSHMKTHSQENYHFYPYSDFGRRYTHEYKLKSHIVTLARKDSYSFFCRCLKIMDVIQYAGILLVSTGCRIDLTHFCFSHLYIFQAPTNTQNYILPPEKPLKTPKPATLAKAFRARRVYTNRGRG